MPRRVVWMVLSASMFLAAAASAQETPPSPEPPPPPSGPMPTSPRWQEPMPPPGQMPIPVPPMFQRGPGVQPRVQVTVDSGPQKNAVLERRVKIDENIGRTMFIVPQHSETQTWEQVCVAPCTVHLDRSSSYRVGRENGVTTSSTFTLPPGTDPLKLEVQPGNYLWHHTGTRLIAAGTAAAIVGGALISTASTWDSAHAERHVRAAGIITASIGLLFLAAGIPMALVTQTHVKANERKVARLMLDGLSF